LQYSSLQLKIIEFEIFFLQSLLRGYLKDYFPDQKLLIMIQSNLDSMEDPIQNMTKRSDLQNDFNLLVQNIQ